MIDNLQLSTKARASGLKNCSTYQSCTARDFKTYLDSSDTATTPKHGLMIMIVIALVPVISNRYNSDPFIFCLMTLEALQLSIIQSYVGPFNIEDTVLSRSSYCIRKGKLRTPGMDGKIIRFVIDLEGDHV